MDVVVHEFEIEPATESAAPAAPAEQAEARPALEQEFDRLLRLQRERALRVWAH